MSLAERACSGQVDLDRAHALTLDAEKEVTVTVDTDVDCVYGHSGTKSVYVTFRLPASAEPYIVSIASRPQGSAILWPHLLLLDEQGITLRELPRDTFLFRGRGLSANFRTRGGEHYLVVTSDPDTAGQITSRIVGNTQANTASTGTAFFVMYTGSETTSTLTYAHNGVLNVSARPIPKAN